MKRMRIRRATLVLAAGYWQFVSVPMVRADAFTITRNDGIAALAVQFFGGEPLISGNASTGPDDRAVGGALSLTTNSPGVLSATIQAAAESRIRFVGENAMAITAEVDTAYFPSNFGGDNPGGMAAAALASVIEFRVPGDYLFWDAELRIEDDASFDGAVHVLFQNLTQSRTLVDWTTHMHPGVTGELIGRSGDLLRVTSIMSASGAAEPGSFREYETKFTLYFMIPEPATLALVGAGLVLAIRPRRRAAA